MGCHCHGCILLFLLAIPTMAPPAAAAWEQQRQPSPPPEANPTLDFHPTAAMMGGLIAGVFLFIGLYSVYILYCSRTISDAAGMGSSRGGRWKRARRQGLDPEVIETFPTLVYSDVKGLMLGKGALECVVCLNEFEDYETLRWIPKCDHVFHPDCINEWLEYHTTCPVCRAELTPQPNEPAYVVPVFTVQHDDVATQVVVQETPDASSDVEPGRDVAMDQQELVDDNMKPNQSYRRGEAGSFKPRRFSRSHSTGHSLIQPGQDTNRFTLRLPVDVRKLVIDRAADIVRTGSSRKGKRTSTDEGSNRGLRYLKRMERPFKSDRWVFPRMASLLARAWTPGNRDDEGSIGRLGRTKEAQMVIPANPRV